MKTIQKHGRKDVLHEQAKQHLKNQQLRGQRLLEKWVKTDIGIGLKDLYNENANKARRVACALQNVENHLKQLNETIISQNFSTTPENVLKIVRIGTANSHRGDIFTEVPLSTTDDALFFIDMTYENTVTDKGQTAADKIYEKAYYNSAGTAGDKSAAGNASTSNAITCGYYPILPFKTLVLIDGILVAMDTVGDGTLTAVANTTWTVSSGTCVLATGVVTIVTSVAVPATSTVTVHFEWDSEQSARFTDSSYPKVSLSISKKRFQATPQMLGYSYTTMTELLLGTTGLDDAEALLLGAVGDEHAKSKDYKAIRIAKSIAKVNTQYSFDTDFAAAGELSYKSHAQKILAVIRDIGGAIYQSIKRGEVNKIVAGYKAVTYLTYHDLWKSNESANKTGLYLAGTLDGIEVYQVPAEDGDTALVQPTEMLLTYKNPLEGLDTSLCFGTLCEISASLAYPQFYIDGNTASVEDYLILNKGFIRLLTLASLPNWAV
jgi:hypothetical protein